MFNGKSAETAETQKASILIANPSRGGYLVAVGSSFLAGLVHIHCLAGPTKLSDCGTLSSSII
jgi:hypothetical protein